MFMYSNSFDSFDIVETLFYHMKRLDMYCRLFYLSVLCAPCCFSADLYVNDTASTVSDRLW